MPKKTDKITSIQQTVFTGRVDELDLFRSLLPLDRPSSTSIDVLAIYGIGGIGKSELVNQFQRVANEAGILNARLDAQVEKGIFDFLTSIYEQLKTHIRFAQFEEGLKHRQEIEDKLLRRGDIHKGALQMFAKGAHTALKIGAIFIPGASLVTDLISPEHVEAAVSTIYSAVGRKEGDFWMKPEEELTDRLVADLYPYTERHRLVLIFDTYELIGGFDDWVCNRLFGNLGDYALLVVAGRQTLQGKGWQRYAPLTRHVELKPLSNEEAREYLRKKGIMNDQIATQMADYTDGVPLTLTLLAELVQQASITDLDLTRAPERRKVIEELLRRITQNVAESLRVALQMCAILRVVTEDSLAYMLDQSDVEQVFAELRKFDFIKVRNDGIALHDAVWGAMNEELSWRIPTQFRSLNTKAAEFYEKTLAEGQVQDREQYILERLYHLIRADEMNGTRVYQERAEELVRYRLVDRLGILLNDMHSYRDCLSAKNNHLWIDYYEARVMQLEQRFGDAERIYDLIIRSEIAESKLQAYALCDLGVILRASQQHSRAVDIYELAFSKSAMDSKLATGLIEQSGAFWRIGQIDKSIIALEKARNFYAESGDDYGLIYTLHRSMVRLVSWGFFDEAFSMRKHALLKLESIVPQPLFLRSELLGGGAFAWTGTGRLIEIEKSLREAMDITGHLLMSDHINQSQDLGYILGMQGKFEEAERYIDNAAEAIGSVLPESHQISPLAILKGNRGAIMLKRGFFDKAEEDLLGSLAGKQETKDNIGIPEIHNFLGELYELKSRLENERSDIYLQDAKMHYQQSLEMAWTRRTYFVAGAHAGLLRIESVQGNYAQAQKEAIELEQLANKHEYNDYLCSLCIVQAQMAWEGHIPEWDTDFDAVLGFYKRSLIYALRYNRFLLDEALSGRPQGTPLTPIIPHCLTKGEEGRKMLVALKEWWQTGTNGTGTPRPDTISPIPEGIPLLEGERIARQREPGDGLSQLTVIEQLEKALSQPI